ncbi:MAG: DUF6526 family protein [Bryobacteraceae bacterium]|jgi:hypothetical protein
MASHKSQNFSNHARFVPAYHFVLAGLIAVSLIGSLVNLYESLGDEQRIYSASLIVVLELIVALLFWYCRVFPLKAQDRAIRAEENLRHFVLAGRLLDPRLGVKQIVALRFAPDDEFVALAARAAGQNLAPVDIKKAIVNWRADEYRV